MQDLFACKTPTLGVLPKQLLKGETLRYLVRVMKITAFILLAFCLQISAKTGAQERITLKEKNASLSKILGEIRKQTGCSFFLSEETIKNSKPIDIDVKNAPLKQVLDICFKDQPFTYHINQNAITIIPKKNPNNDSISGEKYSKSLIDVKGTVVDENGNPISGATVTVQGSLKSTVTNADGSFTLSAVDNSAVLTITHVQYNTLTLKLSGRDFISAKLQVKVSSLDELQVIAYGTTTKRFQTGNVTTIKASDIEKQPVNNPLLALQGRVPGLFIKQSSGLPGAGITVQIQGQNSLGSGNDPFFVIDGVPYPSQVLNTTASLSFGKISPFTYINPADIESISVLKDAEATAIYGSRAANGAILITTKKGKSGQAKVGLNLENGWGRVTRKLDLLNTEQYIEMRKEALKNDGIATPAATDYDINGLWDTTKYTDWQKTFVGGTANYLNVNSTISGGSTTAQYLIGGSYHKETTVYPGSFSDQKGGIHFSINGASMNQKFTFQLTGNYLIDNNKLPSVDFTSQIFLAPNAPNLYKDDGTLNWAPNASGNSSWTNPLSILYQTYQNKTKNLIGSSLISYEVLRGLYVRSSFGYLNQQTNEFLDYPLVMFRPELRSFLPRSATFTDNNINSWIIEPQLSFKRTIAKGKIETLIGATIQQNNNSGKMLFASGYNSDQVLADIRSASNVTVASSVMSMYKYNALFARINYNWADKYVIDLSARRDGSSRFGHKNQFHNFGAIGVAWIFSQESFIRKSKAFLSYGKVRGSYGITGSDLIGDYRHLNLYSAYTSNVAVPYQGITAISTNNLTNPYLQWEATRKLQVGLDLGLLNDRLLLTANYIFNRSSNQLVGTSLPIITGFTNITTNLPALVQNSGWEFTINTQNIKMRGFSWTSSLNVTALKNKLVEFPNLESSGYANNYVIGQPASITRAYSFLGVDPSNGVYLVADSKGDPTANPDSKVDKTVLINTLPKFYGGFNNSLSYKGVQLDIFLQFVKQIGTNAFFSGGSIPGTVGRNQPTSVLTRWQNIGDVTKIQRFNSNSSLSNSHSIATQSDAVFTDASYIRLRNLSLSYQFPERLRKELHLQKCDLYIQGQNLLTITDFVGIDPESQTLNSLPPLKLLILGIRLGL